MTETARYYVRDALAGQNVNLIARGDRRRRERWLVMDATTGLDVDVLSTKRNAENVARDLNASAPHPKARR